jgi:hypothetical protein
MPRTLKDMEAEVEAYCRAKGWYDEEVSLPAAFALLHEEVSEAGHAWREWGLDDATAGVTEENPAGSVRAKPQGTGSELADVFIRLLDCSGRYRLNLPARYGQALAAFSLHDEFLANVNALHDLISRVSAAWEAAPSDTDELASGLARVLDFTFQLADDCGYDLLFEYARKMAFNRDRDYRHGGRRA